MVNVYLLPVDRSLYQSIRLNYLNNLQSIKGVAVDNLLDHNVLSALIRRSGDITGHHFCIIKTFIDQKFQKIGTVLFWHSKNAELGWSKLMDILIFEKFRGSGFGNATVQIILNESKFAGSLYLSLFVSHNNTDARKFYIHLGFLTWTTFKKGEYMLHRLNQLMESD